MHLPARAGYGARCTFCSPQLPHDNVINLLLSRCCDSALRLPTSRNFYYDCIGLEGAMTNHSSSEFAMSRDEDVAASNDASQLDSAGQAILKLLHKAAGAAEANSRRALETAQNLSSQLRAAEDRIAELDAEVQHCQQRNTVACSSAAMRGRSRKPLPAQ